VQHIFSGVQIDGNLIAWMLGVVVAVAAVIGVSVRFFKNTQQAGALDGYKELAAQRGATIDDLVKKVAAQGVEIVDMKRRFAELAADNDRLVSNFLREQGRADREQTRADRLEEENRVLIGRLHNPQ